jgi:hypothetical protein
VTALRALIPSFSAEAAWMVATLGQDSDRAAIDQALAGGRGLRLDKDAPDASSALGRDDVLVGGTRLEGRELALWLAIDRLRIGGPTQAVLLLEQWLGAR